MNILWITADYFIDCDFHLVPYIRTLGVNVIWKVVRTSKNIQIPSDLECEVFSLNHKSLDVRVIFDYKKIFSDVDWKNIDIVYSDFVGVPFYYPYVFRQLKKGGNVPLVHAAHNIIPYKGWTNRWLMEKYLSYVFNKNQYFQIFSKHLIPYFEKHYPGKTIFSCPLVVKSYGDVSTDMYQVDPDKLNLLFFGNIKENKRLDLLIESMNSLPADLRDNVHLTIAGKCGDIERYKTLIGNNSNISTYFKRIDDSEVAELFVKHDFLVLPYSNVAQSGPHMIAYSYCMPVICSDIDGFREHVTDGETGFLFDVDNAQSLIASIGRAYRNKKSTDGQIKRNLKEYVEKTYSLQSVSTRYVEFFKSIVNQ